MMYTPSIRLVSKPVEVLAAAARPAAGLPEVVPWYFFHRKTYTSGTTTALTFFDSTETDPQLSNMELAGALPTPQFFEVYSFHCDILTTVALQTTATGPINDNLLLRRFGRWSVELAGKVYGEFPLTGIGPIGNPTGAIAGAGGEAADEFVSYSGWAALFAAADPIITIPPTTGFRARLRWTSAQTLSGNVTIEFGIWGALHRKVV